MLDPFYPFFLYSFHQVQYMPDIPGAQTQFLKAAGKGVVEGDVGFQGADRGHLEELGQVGKDGVDDHWHQEVATGVLLSTKPFHQHCALIANLAKIQHGAFVLHGQHVTSPTNSIYIIRLSLTL